MRASHSPRHYPSSFTVLGLSLTLLVVVLSSLVWLVAAGDDEQEDTCESSSSSSSSSSSNTGPRFHPQDESLLVYPYDSLASTQDEAKRIAETILVDDGRGDESSTTAPPLRSFVVTTREQSNGRGTHGRVWMGQRGNVFCTIGIRQADWMASQIPLTLLPLKIGSLVAQSVQRLLDECYPVTKHSNHQQQQHHQQQHRHSDDAPLVTVKWPNDVLVDEQKISGVLIESSTNGWFLIGIGINLAYAPEVPQSGPNHGRIATSLSDLCPAESSSTTTTTMSQSVVLVGENEAEELGISLAFALNSFLSAAGTGLMTGENVLQEWKQWIDWDMELVMRDTPGQERVKMVGVLPDGRIQVQSEQDGRIQTLVSDYFL